MGIRKKTKILIKEMNQKLVEREHAIPMLFLTLFSNSNILLLGPPGVGKTHMVGLMIHFLEDLKLFDYLITGNTSLDELFGTKITNESGGTEYNIEHSMLDSEIVFIDEAYKAPPAILNSFLGVAHSSRSFYQRGRGMLRAKVKIMVLASNEVPENDAAEAFEDRIGIKLYIDEIKEAVNYKKYLKREFDRSKHFSTQLKNSDLKEISIHAQEVFIHDRFVDLYTIIKNKLALEKVIISDRKASLSLDIFQVSAYINNRDHVNLTELFLLLDIAWRKPDEITRIHRVVFDAIFSNPSEVKKTLLANQEYYKNIKSLLRSEIGNFLNFSHEFIGKDGEVMFLNAHKKIKDIFQDINIVKDNCQSLKDNYLFARNMEKEIKENIFLPHYTNHIYSDGLPVGDGKVNKNDIFQLSENVELIVEKLSFWLLNNKDLYDYNSNRAISKGYR